MFSMGLRSGLIKASRGFQITGHQGTPLLCTQCVWEPLLCWKYIFNLQILDILQHCILKDVHMGQPKVQQLYKSFPHCSHASQYHAIK